MLDWVIFFASLLLIIGFNAAILAVLFALVHWVWWLCVGRKRNGSIY